MNLVFYKDSLKVLSLFDNHSLTGSDEDILKSMFPKDFKKLSLWQIESSIAYNPCHLKIKMDEEDNPEILLYRGKEVYKRSNEDEKRQEKQKIKNVKKILGEILPRGLFRSVGSDIIKLWVGSPYTDPCISKSLQSFDYFIKKPVMPVLWWGTFINAGGYANMNRSIVFRLHNYHIVAKTQVVPAITQVSQTAQYYVSKYSSLNFRKIKKYPQIYGFGPQPHAPHSGKTIFYTMMETETLHPEFRNLCNIYADEVWVPSSHNKKLFEEYGVQKPVYLMPLGIDEVVYRQDDKRDIGVLKDKILFADILGKPASQGINSFRFITLFGWSYRKGIDILIKSFVKAFKGNDDVTLIIASTHVGPDIIKRDTLKYAGMVRKSNYPQILFYPHVTPEIEMPLIYKMGHAFIHTSRGEGFSLPQIEASAAGLPVISCNNTGMGEYLTDKNAFLITTDKKEICSPEMLWISGYYHNQLFPKLGNDQIDQAIKHMHFVINNYHKAKEKGQKLREEVYQRYTWKHVTERVASRIEEIYSGN